MERACAGGTRHCRWSPRRCRDGWPGLPLPHWVAELFGRPGASLGSLTADAWPCLPRQEPLRRRIPPSGGIADPHVLLRTARPARGHAAGGRTTGPSGPVPRWKVPRGAGDPEGPLTFGALLDVPGTGVVAALEVAALLEQDGDADLKVPPAVALPIMRWGHPGCALLPRSLRQALDGEVLPPAVAGDLGLAPGATVGTLDENVWQHADGDFTPSRGVPLGSGGRPPGAPTPGDGRPLAVLCANQRTCRGPGGCGVASSGRASSTRRGCPSSPTATCSTFRR